jgi:acyl carrier protein
LALERLLDNHKQIERSAVVLTASQEEVYALIEAAPEYKTRLPEVIDAVQLTNSSLPFDKRIQKQNIAIVDKLPVTQKATLFRKEISRILKENGGVWPASRTLYPTSSSAANTVEPASASSAVPDHILHRVEEILSEVLGARLEDVEGASRSLSELSINSLAVVRLSSAIQKAFGCSVKHSDFYVAGTVGGLASLIASRRAGASAVPQSVPTATPAAPTQPSVSISDDDIVISGAACKFPGGINSLDDLWSALVSPNEHVKNLARPAPPSRWDAKVAGADLPIAWLEDKDLMSASSFASFFGLMPAEAQTIPPSARLIVQLGYAAIEDAGIAPKSLDGKPWAVFTSMNDSGWNETRRAKLSVEGMQAFLLTLDLH